MTDLYPTPYDAAQLYGVMGWRVAPVRPGSKVPSISEWQKRATTDADTIREWWNNTHEDLGVCIVTGKETGLWVLDVDVAGGKPGLETLKQLVADNGGESLGETLVARTPSGGYHYYFTYPDDCEIHNSASNRLGAGLDVRGEGGQINAAPTVRGDSCYRWADGRAPWAAEVQSAPAWLVALVKDTPKPLLSDGAKKGTPESLPTHSPTAARAISASLHELDSVPTFVTDYNARTSWEQLLTDDGWAPCQTHGEIDYWARLGKSCREGISASTNYAGSDLLYVWSTSIDGLPSDRAYDRYGYMVHRDYAGDFDAAARHFVEERSAARQTAPAATGADLPTPPAPNPETKPPPAENDEERSRYELLSIDFDPDGAFWNADVSDADFLIEPLIARGRGHAIYAGAKTGKSYVVLQAIAAACVPDHRSWVEPVAEPLSIVYLDYEMTEADLRERLEMFGYSKDDDLSRLHYVKAGALGADLDTYDGGQDLTRQAVAWGAQLVIVDTLSRAVRGEENEADTLRDFYRFTGSPLKANGIAVLRLDHAGKESGKGARGTSAKNDDVDVVWLLERTDDGAKLTNTHSRVFWMPPEIALRYEEDGEGLHRFTRVEKAATYTSGTAERAAKWRQLEIPMNASRRAAAALGFKCRAEDFESVKRYVNLDRLEDLIGGSQT